MTDQHDTAALTRNSYHEAGHAVAASCWGREIIAVSIDPKGRGAQVNLWPSARNADMIRQSLVILCAGPVASMIFDPTADRGDADDASQLIETGWRLVGRAFATAEMHDHELRLAERRAAKLIRDHWAHVEQTAQSLLRHHRLVARGPHVENIGDLDSA